MRLIIEVKDQGTLPKQLVELMEKIQKTPDYVKGLITTKLEGKDGNHK